MKKILLYFFTAAALFTAAIPAFSMDLTVGATTWYSIWDTDTEGPKNVSAFLYGPALALKINDDFGLNSVFMYGVYDIEFTGNSYDYKRVDSDTSLGYRINDYIKLFCGVKYMGYFVDISGGTMKHQSAGPGVGLSGVIPIGNDFFFLANVSGLYLWGKTTATYAGAIETSFYEYGINSSASLAYYIPAASVTLSLGGRYQLIKTVDDEDYKTLSRYYGVTASATYTFGF